MYKHGYTSFEADPCVFTKKTPVGTIISSVTTYYFLISEPSDTLITEYKKMLTETYTFRDLFKPSKYL